MTALPGWSTSPPSPRMPARRRRASRISLPPQIFHPHRNRRRAGMDAPARCRVLRGADLFNQKLDGTAWRSKPSWYIVANNDRTVQAELQRFVAKRMGATIYEVDSSHVPMLSQPSFVIDVIRTAANALSSAATRTA